MQLHANPKRYAQARTQRQHLNATEYALWQCLRARKLGPRFHRQKVIGDWIVDFWCPAFRLVVEIHSAEFPYAPEREQALKQLGVREVLILSGTEPLGQMLQMIRGSLMRNQTQPMTLVCQKHPDSGLTSRGQCWQCFAESYNYGQ